MKVLAATLVTLLLLATCSPSDGHLGINGIPSTCCFSYSKQRIPASRVSFAFATSSACTHQAVIVVTTKGKQVCVDPKAAWVQELLRRSQSLQN